MTNNYLIHEKAKQHDHLYKILACALFIRILRKLHLMKK